MHRKAFTLLELLIVIAILAVLATVAVLVINPAEYARQARDAKRIGDIEALNKGIALARQEGISLGNASIAYVSLLDTASSTCGSYVLPTLPAGWQYQCVTNTANIQSVNGLGWIPINFGGISGGAPMATLPVDPTGTQNAGAYYMYVTNGSAWTISAGLESGKYLKQTAAADGGFDPARFELGVDLTLNAKELGLVGYWPLDEGSGTVARDATGNGNNSTSANIGWVTSGCPAGGCVTVASTNGTIGIPGNAAFDLHTNFTISNWVRIDAAIPASSWPVSFGDGNSHIGYNFRSTSNGTSWMFEYGTDYPTCSGTIWSQSATLALGTNAWHMLTASYDGANIRTYLDGVLVQTKAFATGMCTWQPLYIANTPAAGGIFSVDDTRFYNRVLTTSEIQAMYNAMK